MGGGWPDTQQGKYQGAVCISMAWGLSASQLVYQQVTPPWLPLSQQSQPESNLWLCQVLPACGIRPVWAEPITMVLILSPGTWTWDWACLRSTFHPISGLFSPPLVVFPGTGDQLGKPPWSSTVLARHPSSYPARAKSLLPWLHG